MSVNAALILTIAQARDLYGNLRCMGGDDFRVSFLPSSPPDK
jgi:hypothetical protein